MKISLVSCCILQKKNKILVSKRKPQKIYSDCWEFPGGKLEKNESFQQAIIRELQEELGIRVEIKDLTVIDNISHSYHRNQIIILAVFFLKKWKGFITAKESQEIQWVSKSYLKKLNFLEGSKIIIERLNSDYYNFYL